MEQTLGKKVIIRKLRITPSDKRLSLKIFRKQFPPTVSFSMTINKRRGQSLSKGYLYMLHPVLHMDNYTLLFQELKAKEV